MKNTSGSKIEFIFYGSYLMNSFKRRKRVVRQISGNKKAVNNRMVNARLYGIIACYIMKVIPRYSKPLQVF